MKRFVTAVGTDFSSLWRRVLSGPGVGCGLNKKALAVETITVTF